MNSRWTIKARISNKTQVRNFENARGPGKLFSCDLVDQSGEIRATAFNAECDKFHPILEVGKVHFRKSSIRLELCHFHSDLLCNKSVLENGESTIQYS